MSGSESASDYSCVQKTDFYVDGKDYFSEALKVYRCYYELFYHVSWIDNRHEDITYLSAGKWEIKATIGVNFVRVLEIAEPFFGEKTLPTYLPIVEQDKLARGSSFEACFANGTQAKTAPSEMCYNIELQIILGSIADAIDKGFYKPTTDDEYKKPSPALCQSMLDEISSFTPPTEAPKEFIERFVDKLSDQDKINGNGEAVEDTDEGIAQEFKEYAENCPTFLALFVHFVYRTVTLLVTTPIQSTAKDMVILLTFHEYVEQTNFPNIESSILSNFKRVCCRMFDGSYLHGEFLRYPLSRIGTSESEIFAINAPEWTAFSPTPTKSMMCQAKTKCRGEEHVPCLFSALADWGYISNKGKTGNGPAFDVDATLSEDKVVLQTQSVWNRNPSDENPGPRRRLISLEARDPNLDQRPKNGWGEFALDTFISYELQVNWLTQSGRKGQAYLVFLIVSLICILTIGCKIYCQSFKGEGFCFLDSFTFFPLLNMAIPLFMLVYSNLQEKVPFYRKILMSGPIFCLRCGVVADMVALCVGILSEYTGILNKLDGIILISILFLGAVVVAAVALYKMVNWYMWNRDSEGKNKKWYTGKPIGGKIPTTAADRGKIG